MHHSSRPAQRPLYCFNYGRLHRLAAAGSVPADLPEPLRQAEWPLGRRPTGHIGRFGEGGLLPA